MLYILSSTFCSPLLLALSENWFSVDAKECIALAVVEVLEATEMKPSDLNGQCQLFRFSLFTRYTGSNTCWFSGLADPYVKGKLGPYKFRTRTQKKTLSPKWHEEFKIPIFTWESDNILAIEVLDKDHVFDDTMGYALFRLYHLIISMIQLLDLLSLEVLDACGL